MTSATPYPGDGMTAKLITSILQLGGYRYSRPFSNTGDGMTKRKYEHQESDIDRVEEAYEKRRAARAMVVGEWLRQNNKQATYAAIARQFKEWASELDAILQTLKVAGVVDWDEYRPAPTMIKYQSMRTVNANRHAYNCEPIIHKDSRTYPTAAVSDNYFRN